MLLMHDPDMDLHDPSMYADVAEVLIRARCAYKSHTETCEQDVANSVFLLVSISRGNQIFDCRHRAKRQVSRVFP